MSSHPLINRRWAPLIALAVWFAMFVLGLSWEDEPREQTVPGLAGSVLGGVFAFAASYVDILLKRRLPLSRDPNARGALRRWRLAWFAAYAAMWIGLTFVSFNLVRDKADIVWFLTFVSFFLVLGAVGTWGGPVRSMEPRPDEELFPPRR